MPTYNLGVALYEAGDIEGALGVYQDVFDLQDTSNRTAWVSMASSAHDSIGMHRFKVGDFKSAIKSHRRALERRGSATSLQKGR